MLGEPLEVIMSDCNLNQKVISIKNNIEEVNRLIQEYKPFIASTVQSYVGRYVEYGVDDELSIALMAFHESIQKYDINKGNFLSFAKITIKHRLIDYYRKEQKKQAPVYLEQVRDEDEEEVEDLSSDEAIKQFNERQLAEFRRMELEEIKKELARWNITFSDVARSSPKQEGTRAAYLDVINFIMSTPELLEHMKKKKYLPVEKIVKATKIPRKTVERGRNYIVAAVLILSGDYQYIKDYIQWR
jgi:RNA polymerase sigma factor